MVNGRAGFEWSKKYLDNIPEGKGTDAVSKRDCQENEKQIFDKYQPYQGNGTKLIGSNRSISKQVGETGFGQTNFQVFRFT